MARYPDYETKEGIARRWAEGRGSGEKSTYKPWFTRFDFPSTGERRESFFKICDRGLHPLSKLEFNVALFAKHTHGVTDLWEQYPMPLDETREIAAQERIPHPRSPRTGEDLVMTTDLVLIFDSADGRKRTAWTTKYSDALRNWRSLEKLHIAERWHKLRADKWMITTERDLPENLISNLDWLHPLERRDAMLGFPSDLPARVADVLRPLVERRDDLLWRLALEADTRLRFDRPISLYVSRFLLSNGIWRTELETWKRTSEPLHLLP